MRGKAGAGCPSQHTPGITPAHAGKSEGGGRGYLVREDHPRACGEKKKNLKIWANCEGSPPRMRGKGHLGAAACARAGITPAHAGKSPPDSCLAWCAGDHPRACGEKTFHRFFLPFAEGSPPRMRGKAISNSHRMAHIRITPAHAGKSTKLTCNLERTKDHPRACGEK